MLKKLYLNQILNFAWYTVTNTIRCWIPQFHGYPKILLQRYMLTKATVIMNQVDMHTASECCMRVVYGFNSVSVDKAFHI